ncbi:MAG: hypothetical protein E4H37_05780 [Gemmatimonadales bacterium]|nr:MAG: hypothetical protein E4H37_05780 [Gemmatimonadales bacterium]
MSGDSIPVRIMVHEAWDEVELDFPATTSVAEAKQRALELTHVDRPAEIFEVKYRGGSILDESISLRDAGVVPNAGLIVLRRRRSPVR